MKTLSNLDLNQNELRNALIHPLSSPPEGGQKGQVYYNVSDNRLYQFDGTEWMALATMADVGGSSSGSETETVVVTCEEGEIMMDNGKTKAKYLVNVSMTTPEIIAALDEGKTVEIMDGDGFIYRLTVYTHNGGSMQAIFTACDMGNIIQCIFVAEYDDNGTEQFAMAYKASEKITTSSSQKTLIATAWEEDESGNSFQKVSVSSVGEESDCIIGLSSNATAEQREAARKAKLFATKLEAGYITVVADGTVPTVNIPIEIIYM